MLAVLILQAVLQHGWCISFNLDLCSLRSYHSEGTALMCIHVAIAVRLNNCLVQARISAGEVS